MAATPQKPAAATPRRKAGRHRGEGQWAVGHFTPLNGNEQFKKDDDGLNVRTRIETIYSKRGFDSIDPNDLRGRMRWWGLYTQRKPGIDGGKTAILEPEELDDKYFMLRVRIDGGRLTTEQLRVIGEISQEFARGTADITDRQNIQCHWIRIEDVPEIWDAAGGRRALDHRGLRRHARASSSARRSPASPRTRSSTAPRRSTRSTTRYIGSKEFSNLPRKFKTAISGSPLLDVVARDQRRRVRRRRPPRARPRLRPVGRRRPLHQPQARRAARRLGAAGRGPGRLGGRRRRSSATTATAGCAPAPA